MKKIITLFLLVVISTIPVFATTDSTVVTVFKNNDIHFGDPTTYESDSIKVEDNGRIISRTLELPDFGENVQIRAHVIIRSTIIGCDQSTGDPWDRAGTVFLDVPGMEQIELLKYVTGFGGYSDLSEDVSFLAPLLRGQRTIKGFVDTWVSPGWKMDFELIYKVMPEEINPTWNNGIFFDWSLTEAEVTAFNPMVNVSIPENPEKIILSYFTSGHCTDGTGADEFISKDNVIYVDREEVYRYKPWRDDCRQFRDRNPCSGRWGDDWSSDFDRSGWCPGDVVHPVRIDMTQYLTPGSHNVQFAVKDIRRQDASGYGYWRVSSFLSGWGDISSWQASKILLTGPEKTTIRTNMNTSLRIDLVDSEDNVVIVANGRIRVSTDNEGPLFSYDQEMWDNPLEIDIQNGSTQVWMNSAVEGTFVVSVEGLNEIASYGTSNEITIKVSDMEYAGDNIALLGTAVADCECNSQTEIAQFAIDGSLETKWCCNDAKPDWLVVTLPDSMEMNYFVIRHAGAGQAPPSDPGFSDNSGMNTEDFKIQTPSFGSKWSDLVTVIDNPPTEEGDITYHALGTPAKTNQIRLYITDPGGDNATRIYEFEIYNRPETSVEESNHKDDSGQSVPETYHVYQNYPNPFNNQTRIKIFLPNLAKLTASVINGQGQLVAHVLNGSFPKGFHSVTWNAKDMNGDHVSSGVYFLNVKVTDMSGKSFNITRKMLYLR